MNAAIKMVLKQGMRGRREQYGHALSEASACAACIVHAFSQLECSRYIIVLLAGKFTFCPAQ